MVHVLITGAIMAMLAAGMMSIVLMQYQLIHRTAYGNKGEKYDEMAFSLLLSFWSEQQAVCSDANLTGTGAISYDCTGTPGVCSCTCSATPADTFYPTVTADDTLGPCLVTASFTQPLPGTTP